MEAQTSGSQSSGQSSGRRKKKSRKPISCKLHVVNRTLDKNVGLGRVYLELPYHPETSRLKKDSYPSLFLDVKDKDQIEVLKMQKRLSHPNILQVHLVNQVKGGVQVYVEPYSGVLSKVLKKSSLVNPKTSLVPSADCRAIVSEVIDGLNYLRENGQFHGNFAWNTTFYSNDTKRMVTKLANLERKGSRPLVECQVADCVSLGYGLAELSEHVKRYHAVPEVSCCLIDNLSSCLISVTNETLVTVMDGIKNHVFFWDENKRRTFVATEVPEAWDRPAFENSFTHSPSMPALPWNNDYHGYFQAMEDYRVKVGMEKYDTQDWKEFLRCIAGMYIHQHEIDIKKYIMSVDSSVHDVNPRLCLDLKAAIDQPDQPPMGQP